MAEKKHLRILRKGVDAWNKWRNKNHQIRPDLNGANLKGINLRGASLYASNLNGVNLDGADLMCVNFNGANLEGASLCEANLYGGNILSTNLKDANLANANINSARLTGARFIGARLIGAKFIGANLNGVDFTGANLTNVSLMRVQALASNFEAAILTGACIENWNINSKTNLQNVKCEYVYLKAFDSEEENNFVYLKNKKFQFRDRRPHDPEKIFASGEFTQLFQQALDTVDLIFSDGIDWQAFLVSFNKLQIECGSDELSINSFENKGNGAFVVRVNVPNGTDKAEIEKYLKRQYQLEATVEAQQRELTNLYEVTKLLAARPINVTNQASGNTYKTEKAGIVHNEDNISGNVKIAAEINEAPQQEPT